jgi:hypothetical protein
MSLPTTYSWFLDAPEGGSGGSPSDAVGATTFLGLPKLESRIDVPIGGWSLELTDDDGTVTVTIPEGSYYLNSVAPGGTVSFVGAVEAALNDGAGVTYEVVVDDDLETSTGRVTITPSTGTFGITWIDDEPRDILGFEASFSGVAVSISTKHARRLWLPNSGRMPETPDPAFGEGTQDFGRPEADYLPTFAPSGASTTTVFNVRRVDTLAWARIYGRKTWLSDEQIVNESYERFWLDVMEAGGVPIRYYSYRADDLGYWSLDLDADASDMHPVPEVQGWVGKQSLWSFKCGVRKHVVVDDE